MSDTIAAIATPPGDGGLGVVRLSGPQAVPLADLIFRSTTPLSAASSHTLHHGFLSGPDGVPIDESVAAVFRAPRSYTGEDVVEFSCHGGRLLLKRVLDLCLQSGARLAGPGEFTRRAFLNGKMDLAQAEAVADLIAARSETLRRAGLAQLQGGLSRRVETLRQSALHLLAALEAGLDFVDDEIPPVSRGERQKQLKSLRDAIGGLLATATRGRLLRDGLRVAIVGKPNAGKSSLFNALLGDPRAIVADRPGTTRDTLEERVLFGDVPVALTDTAGLRETGDPVEIEGVERARRAIRRADLLLWVADGSNPPGPEDGEAGTAEQKSILVLAKSDRVPADKRPARAEAWRRRAGADRPWVFTSALTGEGIEDLRRAVLGAADGAPGAGFERGEDDILINARHESHLRAAGAALAEAERPDAPEEAVALDLRRCVGEFGELTGRGGSETTDEVLDAIFSHFCIGK